MLSNGRDNCERRYRALLIGNAHFPGDPGHFPVLPGPERDVVLLKEVLCDPEVGLHDKHDVTDLFDGRREEIRNALTAFFGSGCPGDQLLLYYSGHARRTVSDNTLYLAAADTVAATDIDLIDSGISTREIAELVSASDATATVIVLDCCYAGAFPDAAFAKGSFGIFSARDFEPVPAAAEGQASPFTQCFADALSSAQPRSNEAGRRFLSVEDVYFYVLGHLPPSYRAQPTRLLPPLWVGTVSLGRVSSPIGAQRPATGSSLTPSPRVLPDSVITLNGPPPMAEVPPGRPSFLMSRHLVTNRQFAEFLADDVNAGWRPGGPQAMREADQCYLEQWPGGSFDPETGHFPVVSVSALAADAYLRWAGAVTGQRLRLPRLSEWTDAARAGRDPNRFLGEEIREGRVNFYGTDRRPSEVGVFGLNPYGIGDLIGNARELCLPDESRRLDKAALMCGGWYLSRRHELTAHEPITLRECRADTGFRCVAEGA